MSAYTIGLTCYILLFRLPACGSIALPVTCSHIPHYTLPNVLTIILYSDILVAVNLLLCIESTYTLPVYITFITFLPYSLVSLCHIPPDSILRYDHAFT